MDCAIGCFAAVELVCADGEAVEADGEGTIGSIDFVGAVEVAIL
jgi:hypothetical protein